MSDFNFKVGDKVYYPTVSNSVLTLIDSEAELYPVRVDYTEGYESFTTEGKLHGTHLNPSIFPATQEWYDKLVHVYPNLEKPSKRKDPKEIIQVMLDDGNEGVLCWLSDSDREPDMTCAVGIVSKFRYEKFVCDAGGLWLYATPIMPVKSLSQTVVDFVDGELVLED